MVTPTVTFARAKKRASQLIGERPPIECAGRQPGDDLVPAQSGQLCRGTRDQAIAIFLGDGGFAPAARCGRCFTYTRLDLIPAE